MIPHMKTSMGLTVTKPDGTPVQVTTDHHNYDEILDLVQTAEPTQLAGEALEELIKPYKAFQKQFSVYEGTFEVTEYGELICTINGFDYSLDPSLVNHILRLHKENGDITPLLKFVVKLSRNPRKEVADELWSFISVCGLSLTEEGNFLAYKNVRDNFKSIHDGKTDNSPGRVLSMPRQQVEYNPNRTCSAGLHFAAWGYLSSYSVGGKTVLLSISPEDVVSIPTDYNNMKGRACQYKVLREVAQPKELEQMIIYYEDDELEDTAEYQAEWTTRSPLDVVNGTSPETGSEVLYVQYTNGTKELVRVDDADWGVATTADTVTAYIDDVIEWDKVDREKADVDDLPWDVDSDSTVAVLFDTGNSSTGTAEHFDWSQRCIDEITHYRVLD